MPRKDDYEVGYRKPPKNKQFKPGQSGNNKGRPKGSKNFSTLIAAELDRKIPVNIAGERKTVDIRVAIVKRMISNALNGDKKALDWIEKHLPEAFEFETPEEGEKIDDVDKFLAMCKEMNRIKRMDRYDTLNKKGVPKDLLEKFAPDDKQAQNQYDKNKMILMEYGLDDDQLYLVLGERPEDTGF